MIVYSVQLILIKNIISNLLVLIVPSCLNLQLLEPLPELRVPPDLLLVLAGEGLQVGSELFQLTGQLLQLSLSQLIPLLLELLCVQLSLLDGSYSCSLPHLIM